VGRSCRPPSFLNNDNEEEQKEMNHCRAFNASSTLS
jgi:hypothetical protein